MLSISWASKYSTVKRSVKGFQNYFCRFLTYENCFENLSRFLFSKKSILSLGNKKKRTPMIGIIYYIQVDLHRHSRTWRYHTSALPKLNKNYSSTIQISTNKKQELEKQKYVWKYWSKDHASSKVGVYLIKHPYG